jgi:hypothetical protein
MAIIATSREFGNSFLYFCPDRMPLELDSVLIEFMLQQTNAFETQPKQCMLACFMCLGGLMA